MTVRIAVLALLAVMLSACATGLQPRVVSYVTRPLPLPPSAIQRTIWVDPGDPKYPADKGYAEKIAAHLRAAGFHVVPYGEPPRPDYLVLWGYKVEDHGVVTENYMASTWGPTGVRSVTIEGTIRGNTFSGTATPSYDYGVVGQHPASVSGREFKRTIYLEIDDLTHARVDDEQSMQNAKFYAAEVHSSGSCPGLKSVIDPMLASLFSGFPQPTNTVGAWMNTQNLDDPDGCFAPTHSSGY